MFVSRPGLPGAGFLLDSLNEIPIFQIMVAGAIIFFVGMILFYIGINAYRKSKKIPEASQVPDLASIDGVLQQKVSFYLTLNAQDQKDFCSRIHYFLSQIKITPVQLLRLQAEDRILIAAAGVIPLFRYPNWFYNNLNEVLVYPGAFHQDFQQTAAHPTILGMVGDGPLHRTMILSLPSLRAGFQKGSASNTAIHEFAHLLDKSDGATDGIPELILQSETIQPWIRFMHQYIQLLRKESLDIDPYGATNEAEFFAVMAEYFFQQPATLQKHHPELFQILDAAFNNKKG